MDNDSKNIANKYCPQCKIIISESSKFLPFCSERCQLIDLGEWAAEKFRIPVIGEAEGQEKEE